MQEKFDRETARAALETLAKREDIDASAERALRWVLDLTSYDAEGLNVETIGGDETVLVELTHGIVIDRGNGPQHCDKVRLRRPTTIDEWRRDALAAEINGGKAPPQQSILYDMCLLAQVIVDWPGVPIVDVEQHLGRLTRYDSGRLVSALYALEDHCERAAIAGKSARRSG